MTARPTPVSTIEAAAREEQMKMPVLHTYDIPCPVCGREETTSWDKRLSRALGYNQIVCEACIAEEYGMSVGELRHTMEEHFGMLPCPGLPDL